MKGEKIIRNYIKQQNKTNMGSTARSASGARDRVCTASLAAAEALGDRLLLTLELAWGGGAHTHEKLVVGVGLPCTGRG